VTCWMYVSFLLLKDLKKDLKTSFNFNCYVVQVSDQSYQTVYAVEDGSGERN
jgi:hypothetical protein